MAFAAGDGVAMGVGGGMAEEGVDAVDDAIGDGVLECVGFFMYDGPVEAEDFDQEQFDEAMASQHVERQLLAAAGEAHAGAGFVFHQA